MLVECVKSFISVVNKEINTILSKYDYPELFVKIQLDMNMVICNL